MSDDGIIVAFRGTLPPAWTIASLEDWWQDIVDAEPIAAAPLPGKVHEGFWDALQTLWSGVLAEVRSLHAAHPNAPIHVTGHSKGGPLASIGAARLLLAEQLLATHVVTFASPHPGDGAFVSGYPPSLPVIRFENYLDIVPFLPPTDTFYRGLHSLLPPASLACFCSKFPSLCNALENASKWNYQPLGTLDYVTSEGTLVDAADPAANPDWRLLQILWIMVRGVLAESGEASHFVLPEEVTAIHYAGLARIGAAHCVGCHQDLPGGCAGGYMTGAGGDPICPAA